MARQAFEDLAPGFRVDGRRDRSICPARWFDRNWRAVSQVVRTDGLKLLFSDGSWVCYRLSGTEPVVRVYTEARSEKGLEKLSTAAKHWIFE